MKTNKEITEALKLLANAINRYADAIPQPNFQKSDYELEFDEKIEKVIFSSTPPSELNPHKENPMVEEKPELEIGKWYKGEDYCRKTYLACITGKNEEGNYVGYGIDGEGYWHEGNLIIYFTDVVLATNKEVEEALIQEAEKRGYNKYPHKFHYEERPPCKLGIKYSPNWVGKTQCLYDADPKKANVIWDSDNGWREIIKQPEEEYDNRNIFIKIDDAIIHNEYLLNLLSLKELFLIQKTINEIIEKKHF